MNLKIKHIPVNALQKALYTALSTGQSTPVYDHIPSEDDIFPPYITLGAQTFKPWGVKDRDIYACSITLHVWSEYEGKKEVNDIMNDIATVLSSVPLDMTADKFAVMAEEISLMEAYEADPHGYHGVITLDVKIEDKN